MRSEDVAKLRALLSEGGGKVRRAAGDAGRGGALEAVGEEPDVDDGLALGMEKADGDVAVGGLLVEIGPAGMVREDGGSGLALPESGGGRARRAPRFILGDIRVLPSADEQVAVVPAGGAMQVVAFAQDASGFLSSQSCRRLQDRRRRPRWVRHSRAPLSLGTRRGRISRARVERCLPIFAAIFFSGSPCRRPCSIPGRSVSVMCLYFRMIVPLVRAPHPCGERTMEPQIGPD
jgi:hypothetical protein